jgi:hypothetical protein
LGKVAETGAVIKQLVEDLDMRRIADFYKDDAYGWNNEALTSSFFTP